MPDLNSFSRLLKTDQIIFQGKETFGSWSSFSWLETRPADNLISNFYVTSAMAGRPDRIAAQVYGSPRLDWVLIAFAARISNDQTARMGLLWPKAGQIIEIPNESLVMTSLIG